MNLSETLYALQWLIRDTFRQSLASGIFWLMLAISTICIAVCLSVGVTGGEPQYKYGPGERPEILPPSHPDAKDPDKLKRLGIEVPHGEMTIAFGAFRFPFTRYRKDAVHYLELLLAGYVADSFGILLALVFTAGFLPSFLDPSAASVLLTKPVPRWALLFGKYLGVLVIVLCQAVLFVGGTWLALGFRTGVWDSSYLYCIPLLLLHFAVFFSFSVLMAVATRSTVACVFGSVLFWLMCWGMNYGRNLVVTVPDAGSMGGGFGGLVEVGYWVLPKPFDFNLVLFDALEAKGFFGQTLNTETLLKSGAFVPELSVLTSLAFGAAVLALAAYDFGTADY